MTPTDPCEANRHSADPGRDVSSRHTVSSTVGSGLASWIGLPVTTLGCCSLELWGLLKRDHFLENRIHFGECLSILCPIHMTWLCSTGRALVSSRLAKVMGISSVRTKDVGTEVVEADDNGAPPPRLGHSFFQ